MKARLILIVKLVVFVNLVQNKLVLKQVLLLNRHSLRAPLSSNLKDLTPKIWPNFHVNAGYLTAKGAKLAGYMGRYFAAWLKEEGILSASCPSEEDLQVFSNTKERTLKSAQSFIENGFPDCNIHIRHPGVNATNPLFNPVVHNNSVTFKENILKEIHEVLDILQLNEAYELLNQILDYKQSRSCEMEKNCNLIKGKNYVNIVPGLRPQLSGPLKISNQVVDAFLMQFYEGFPNEDIAWGQLSDSNSWQTLIELSQAYFNTTYKTTLLAKDLSRPLTKRFAEIFLKGDNIPKVAMFFGHDVNIHTVFKTLLLRPYILEDQVEVIPIGSAVVFQKWSDDECNKDYFKLSFAYQSTGQIRDSDVLSLETPPKIKTLELEKCRIDVNGFCPWENFENILNNL